MTRLYLVRHGCSVWNKEGRIQGQADPPLDVIGREQARRLAGRLGDETLVAVYTSPLQRARETADIIGRALDVVVVPDERLQEYDVGDISGLTWDQVAEQYPEVMRRWAEDRGGLDIPLRMANEEGSGPFRSRVVAAFSDILTRHAGDSVGVVAHGGTLGTYLNHLIKLPTWNSPFRFDNASLSIVEVNGARPRIVLLNDICHLGGEP